MRTAGIEARRVWRRRFLSRSAAAQARMTKMPIEGR